MTIEAGTTSFSYLGDGATKPFSFPSKFFTAADIVVSLNGVKQTSGFTVLGAGNNSGGSVVFNTAPAVGVVVGLVRAPPLSQLTSFNQSTTLGETVENAIDRLTMIAQLQQFKVDRVLSLPIAGIDGQSAFDFRNNRGTNVKAPVAGSDVVNKTYADAIATGAATYADAAKDAAILTAINSILTGPTNFTGSLTKNNVALATINDVGGAYLGTWNAATNTPALSNTPSQAGSFYIVSTAGSTNLNGISTWTVGDTVRSNGTVWQRIPSNQAVSSVNGQTGSVLLSLFSGAYADLTGKPALFSGSYTDLTNKPSLFSGVYSDLMGKPTYSTVASSGQYADLLGKPSLFSGAYADLTGKPVLFSGSYTDLTNKPSFGGAAFLNVGTATGQVAAGDDARIVAAATLTGTSAAKVTKTAANYATYQTPYAPFWVDIGGYQTNGLAGGGNIGTSSAITGSVSIPDPGTNNVLAGFVAGVSGYARSMNGTSIFQGAVGLYGAGLAGTDGASAWGSNVIVANLPDLAEPQNSRGSNNVNMWGIEIDMNVKKLANGNAPGGNAIGIDLVGNSQVQPATQFRAINIKPAGYLDGIPWKHGVYFEPGATNDGIVFDIGSVSTGNAITFKPILGSGASSSQRLLLQSRKSDNSILSGNMGLDPFGNVIVVPQAGSNTVLAKSDGTSAFAAGDTGITAGAPIAFPIAASSTNVLTLSPTAASGAAGSQGISLTGRKADGSALTSFLRGDQFGNLLMVPATGGNAVLANSSGATVLAAGDSGIQVSSSGHTLSLGGNATWGGTGSFGGLVSAPNAQLSSGGNAGGAGGTLTFSANVYPSTPEAQIKGYLENANSTTLQEQGGVAILTRPVNTGSTPQSLRQTARFVSDGSFLVTNGTSTTTMTPGSATLATSSSETIKKDVENADTVLPGLMRMNVVRFRYIGEKKTARRRFGVIAEEHKKQFPGMVHSTDATDDPYRVEAPDPWVLLKAIQELNAQLEDLRAQLNARG